MGRSSPILGGERTKQRSSDVLRRDNKQQQKSHQQAMTRKRHKTITQPPQRPSLTDAVTGQHHEARSQPRSALAREHVHQTTIDDWQLSFFPLDLFDSSDHWPYRVLSSSKLPRCSLCTLLVWSQDCDDSIAQKTDPVLEP